jgi:hypothetical protein
MRSMEMILRPLSFIAGLLFACLPLYHDKTNKPIIPSIESVKTRLCPALTTTFTRTDLQITRHYGNIICTIYVHLAES